MTYGTKVLKNGTARGYLIFDSGKRVALGVGERVDFENKIRYWEQGAIDRRASELKEGRGRYIPLFDRQGDSGAHNCMHSAFCEACGLDVSEK